MFTEKQLVEFGNYLLKTYGVQVHSTDGKNQPLYQREVTDADFCNWKDIEKQNELDLPSQYQIGDAVWFKLWSTNLVTEIIAVHFYPGKVKYDLKVLVSNGETTRLYNIDSLYVEKSVK